MGCGRGVYHSKTKYQMAIEFGFFPSRKEIAGVNLHMYTMLKRLKKQLRGHQEGRTNNIYIKKRDEHKRQISHKN